MQKVLKALRINIFIFIISLLAGLGTVVQGNAQQKIDVDSLREARQRTIDSTRAAQKQYLDSIRAVRKRVSDSLAVIRAYRSSKKYKDSVARVRQHRLDSIKAERTARLDSIRTERQRVIDSARAVRKQYADSVAAVRKKRADSLAVIRKYRESKRYKDSVAVSRKMRMDSIAAVRKAYNDSLRAIRVAALDSARNERERVRDSMTAIRKAYTDSIATVRKARTDSLAKLKEKREQLQKNREKNREEKMKMAFELKIKKKREAWSNEKMLKKRWGFPRKQLQNTYTRYNYYFNADRKMDEALDNMQRVRKENFDSLIALFPFDPDRDSTVLAADMDSIIQKTSIGIQIHDPRTKWGDDLYLLLGQAFYYKGNYEEASNAFRYIISLNQQRKMQEQREAARKGKRMKRDMSIVEPEPDGFLDALKHRSVNNEAILWLARTRTEARKTEDAESILDLLENDAKVPDNLKGRIALEKAYIALEKKNIKNASSELAMVAEDPSLPDWLRLRASFLAGQILQQQGKYDAAALQYQQVIALHPKIDMDFYARRNLAYSLMEQGGSQEYAASSLRQMLNDGKYAPYYDQVYYVLGRLSVNNNNPEEAITYLKKSLETPRASNKQKAISFASLGNVQYSLGAYTEAKLAYDSAAYLARFAQEEPIVQTAAKRAQVLGQVVKPLQVIRSNDSLLALAAMDDRSQRAVVRKYLKELEDKRSDSLARAEGGGGVAAAFDPSAGSTEWYFSNTALMQQGLNDFKRKWGNRPNSDNWRRGGNMGLAAGRNNNQAAEEEESENGLPSEESLLALIPGTPEKQQELNKATEKAYLELATAYVNGLDDLPNGARALDTLDRRFASHPYKAEELYLRYQIALGLNQLDEAKSYSQRLLKEFSETQWAREVAPKEESEMLLASTVPVSNYYDQTYGLMMQRDYASVLSRVREGQRQYKDPVYNSRFRIMEAIALAGSGSYAQADSLLSNFISTKPTDSLRSWAESVLNFVKRNKAADTLTKAPNQGMNPLDSNLIPKPLDSNLATQPSIPASYTHKPKEPHHVLFTFNKMESKMMGVKAGLTDFNNLKYSNQNLAVSLNVLDPEYGYIIVSTFPSATHARIYMNAMRGTRNLFREFKAGEYDLILISDSNLKRLQSVKDLPVYKNFYRNNFK